MAGINFSIGQNRSTPGTRTKDYSKDAAVEYKM